MKVGSLQFKPFAAKKPLMITPDRKFLTVQQVAAAPSLGEVLISKNYSRYSTGSRFGAILVSQY